MIRRSSLSSIAWLECISCLLTGFFLSHANAQANTLYDEEDALAQLLELNIQREEKVTFIDRQFNPMLKNPLEQRGILWIREDGTMIMRVESPHTEERQLSENYLTLIRSNSRLKNNSTFPAGSENFTRRIALNTNHASHLLLLAIAALLNNNVTMLEQHFELSMTKQGTSWKVKLVPINADLHAELSCIELTGETSNLQSLYVDKHNNGWQRLDIMKLNILPAASTN